MTYGNYPDLSNVSRILVIKLRHQGDVLLTTPVFTELKKQFPHAQITAFIYKDTEPMLAGLSSLSEYLLYDKSWKKGPFWKRLFKEFSLLYAIWKGKYDLVLNLTEGDRGALAAFVSKAKCKVGFDPGRSGFFAKRLLYTHLVKTPPLPRHTVEKQLDVLRRIGIFPTEYDLSFPLEEGVKKKVLHFLEEQGIQDYVLIHPVSRWLFKSPSPLQIAGVIKQLHAKGKKVILSSGPDPREKELITKILKEIPKGAALSVAGEISLKELGAFVLFAKALITVDSLPLHLASVFKTPVVALFGPTSEKTWGPWKHARALVLSQEISCRPCFLDGCGGSKRSECLYSLSENKIVEALETVTNETHRQNKKLSLLYS